MLDAALNPTACDRFTLTKRLPVSEETGASETVRVVVAIKSSPPCTEDSGVIETAAGLETIKPTDPRIDESGVMETAAEVITINATDPRIEESGAIETAWLVVEVAATSAVSEDSGVIDRTWDAMSEGYLRVTTQALAARSTVSAGATTLDEFSGPTTSRLPPDPSSQIP